MKQLITRYNPALQYYVDYDTQPKILPQYKFDDLTVLEQSKKKYFWVCECSCGNIVEVDEAFLLNGVATSCGCKKPVSKPEPEPEIPEQDGEESTTEKDGE